MDINASSSQQCATNSPFTHLDSSYDMAKICLALNQIFYNGLSTAEPNPSHPSANAELRVYYDERVARISSSVLKQTSLLPEQQQSLQKMLRSALATSDMLRVTARYFNATAHHLEKSAENPTFVIHTKTTEALDATSKLLHQLSMFNADNVIEPLTAKCLAVNKLEMLSQIPLPRRSEATPIILEIANNTFDILTRVDLQPYNNQLAQAKFLLDYAKHAPLRVDLQPYNNQLAQAKFLLDYAKHAPLKEALCSIQAFADSGDLAYPFDDHSTLVIDLENAINQCSYAISLINKLLDKDLARKSSWLTHFMGSNEPSDQSDSDSESLHYDADVSESSTPDQSGEHDGDAVAPAHQNTLFPHLFMNPLSKAETDDTD